MAVRRLSEWSEVAWQTRKWECEGCVEFRINRSEGQESICTGEDMKAKS